MQTGDVIFFRKSNNFISRAIAKLTKSDFTHVGLALDEKTIIESDRFINTRIAVFEPNKKLHVIYRYDGLNDTMKEKIKVNAVRYNYAAYDYLQIVQFFFRLVFKWNISFLNRKSHLICSELIDYAFLKSGMVRKHKMNIGNIMVSELIHLYDLKEVVAWQEK